MNRKKRRGLPLIETGGVALSLSNKNSNKTSGLFDRTFYLLRLDKIMRIIISMMDEKTYIEPHKEWVDPMAEFEILELEAHVSESETSLLTGEVFEIFRIH